jgi:hypothetical protein
MFCDNCGTKLGVKRHSHSRHLCRACAETAGSEIEINAKILVVGRELERQDWTRMSGPEAWNFCEARARAHGAGTDRRADRKAIATGALWFVMEGGSTGTAEGEALDAAEIEAEPSDSDRWAERENATYGKREPKGGAKSGCFDV